MGTCKYCNIRHPDFYCPVMEKRKKQGLKLLELVEETDNLIKEKGWDDADISPDIFQSLLDKAKGEKDGN